MRFNRAARFDFSSGAFLNENLVLLAGTAVALILVGSKEFKVQEKILEAKNDRELSFVWVGGIDGRAGPPFRDLSSL